LLLFQEILRIVDIDGSIQQGENFLNPYVIRSEKNMMLEILNLE
jgi:hypothetical protein